MTTELIECGIIETDLKQKVKGRT